MPLRVAVELVVARKFNSLGVSGGNDLVERDFGALVDLETVRATLDYIHGDLARVRRLAPVAAALAKAIDELNAIGASRKDLQFDRLVSLPEGRQIR